MATNREKYINNASNEDLAQIISKLRYSCQYCPAYKECRKDGSLSYEEWIGECEERFLKWLSQEAEEETKEDIVHIPQIGKMPKIDKKVELTEQAYKDILERLGKLEYYKNTYLELFKQMDDSWKDHCKATHNIQLSGYSYGSIEKEKTAYQMFEELGYKINKEYETPTTILYDNAKEDKQIIIDKVSLHFVKRNKNNIPMLITESEDIAIHKKISELKEGAKELKMRSNEV